MKSKLLPYLNFDGQTSEAMKFYQSIFGGKLTLQTFGEAGVTDQPDLVDRVMHAQLENDTLSFMASDTSPEHSPPLVKGNNINMSLVGSDEAKLTEFFNKLVEGGKIDMPLEKQFWGDIYGAGTDRFGIPWMVNITSPVQ